MIVGHAREKDTAHLVILWGKTHMWSCNPNLSSRPQWWEMFRRLIWICTTRRGARIPSVCVGPDRRRSTQSWIREEGAEARQRVSCPLHKPSGIGTTWPSIAGPRLVALGSRRPPCCTGLRKPPTRLPVDHLWGASRTRVHLIGPGWPWCHGHLVNGRANLQSPRSPRATSSAGVVSGAPMGRGLRSAAAVCRPHPSIIKWHPVGRCIPHA